MSADPLDDFDAAPKQAIAKVGYSHEAMIDLIIASPWISQSAIAAHFKYSPAWISRVMASDAFQARLAERTKEIVDPALRANVDNNFKAMILRSQEVLLEKLAAPQPSDQLVLRSLELASRAAGYGAKVAEPPTSPGEVHVHLDILGERLVGLLRQKKAECLPALEHDPLGGLDG